MHHPAMPRRKKTCQTVNVTVLRESPLRRLAAGALGICLLAATGAVRAGDTAEVDRLFAQWDKTNSPGAAVVIVKDGAVVYQHGYGCANLEYHIPNTPQTRFDVASVAKQFTGLSVAMLVQQGKLSLDDDIRKYLPDVPDFGKPITLNHLLHHTSGLRDWPETLSLSEVDTEGQITLDMILEMVRRQRELDFLPGEEHQYSNTGYNLLAAAIARVTGQSFRAWTDTNLFQPLGMKHTQVCADPARIVADRALSYSPAGDNQFRQAVSQLAAQGSSSLFISAEDMGQWLLNFETARVGGKAAIELMQQPGKLNNGTNVDYGFGVGLGDYGGSPMISHGGSWAGYRSHVIWLPEKRFGVAVLANTSNLDPHGLAMKIAGLYLGNPSAAPAPAKPTAAVKADPATWGPFLGTYRLGPGWWLTITREEDQLMAQATHESKFKMTPVSDTNFFVEAYGAAVAFVRNDSGGVTNLLYRGINAPKLDLEKIKVTPARLATYVGDYWSEELRTVGRFEIHDGKLAVQMRSGNWLHFMASGKDRFDAEAWGIVLEFTRNEAGEVTEVKVSGTRVRHIRFLRVTLPGATARNK
jgi:CubicO group peptidase (beta-lactamase class C family)